MTEVFIVDNPACPEWLVGGQPPDLPDLPPLADHPAALPGRVNRVGRPSKKVWVARDKRPAGGGGMPPQPVNQYGPDGVFVKTHRSMADASIDLGKCPNTISRYVRSGKPYMGCTYVLASKDPNTMNNHEMWQTCKHCGLQFDRRLSDHCPECGGRGRRRSVRAVQYPRPQTIWNYR